MDEPEMVERLARALAPAAFEAVARPNAPEWPTCLFEEDCNAARKQVRKILAEIERQGLVIVPKSTRVKI
jgi:hypothetical protein